MVEERDITKLKRAEEALRVSEQRFKNLTETTTDWIWEVDKEGVYTYVSPKVKEFLGYEVSEVLGKTPFDLMPGEEAKRVGKIFKEKVINKEPFYKLENVNRHKDGHLVVLETNGIPIFDEKGQLRGYRGIDRDITKRKKAEERLRESEEKYKALVETTGTGFVIIDGKGIVVDANPEYVRLTGHQTLKEILGRCVVEWTAEHDKERNAKEVKKCFKKGFVRNWEIDYVDKAGKFTPIEINATVVKTRKGPLIITLCRDITKRKRAEKKTAAMAEMEKKRAAELDAANQQLRASEQQLKAANQQLRASEQQLKAANQQLAAKEQALRKSQEELKTKVTDLERFNRLMVGREIEMVKLKEEINALLEKLGQPRKYEAPEKIKGIKGIR